MHIGIDARLTYYRTGGTSTYIRNIVAQIARLDRKNDYTIFHSRKSSPADTITDKLNRANLWTPAHHRVERTALSIELLRHNLDLFHSMDYIPPYWGAKSYVSSVLDLSFLRFPQFMTDESKRYYNAQIEWAVQKADHIMTISEASKYDIITLLGVPSEKVTVHLLAANPQFQPQSDAAIAEMRQQLDLPSAYALFVGTFEPRKNIPNMIEAYRQVISAYPQAPPLVIAGNKGWLFEDVVRDIDDITLNGRVLWRENIPQALLPALYSGATFHTMPSIYEGFGLPALEAMACGTLSVVSNISSLPEVVGDVGLKVDPTHPSDIAQAYLKAITDETWRKEQEQAALQRASTFTWERTTRILLDVYQKLAS